MNDIVFVITERSDFKHVRVESFDPTLDLADFEGEIYKRFPKIDIWRHRPTRTVSREFEGLPARVRLYARFSVPKAGARLEETKGEKLARLSREVIDEPEIRRQFGELYAETDFSEVFKI